MTYDLGPAGAEDEHARRPRWAAVRAGALTLVVHEPPAELLEGAAVAHGAQRAVELVVGHHQVLGVPGHVYDLRGADRWEGSVTHPPRPRPSPTRTSTPHSQREGALRARDRTACARPPRLRWLMRSCCRGVSAEAPVPAAASAGTGLPAFCYPSSSTNSKSVEDEKIPDTSDENSGPQKPHAGERSGNSAVKPRPLTGRGCAKAGRVQVQP